MPMAAGSSGRLSAGVKRPANESLEDEKARKAAKSAVSDTPLFRTAGGRRPSGRAAMEARRREMEQEAAAQQEALAAQLGRPLHQLSNDEVLSANDELQRSGKRALSAALEGDIKIVLWAQKELPELDTAAKVEAFLGRVSRSIGISPLQASRALSVLIDGLVSRPDQASDAQQRQEIVSLLKERIALAPEEVQSALYAKLPPDRGSAET